MIDNHNTSKRLRYTTVFNSNDEKDTITYLNPIYFYYFRFRFILSVITILVIALTTILILQNNPSNKQQQRIIFFAGPHKTASSSIQHNLLSWSQLGLLENYTWASPDPSNPLLFNLSGGKDQKSFAPLLNLLSNRISNHKVVPSTYSKRQKLLELYRDSIRTAWQRGDSIIIASEGGDSILKDVHYGYASSIRFLNGFLSILPWSQKDRRKDCGLVTNETCVSNIEPLNGSDSNLEIVVTYRVPRYTHYVSAWHMFGNPPSLRKFSMNLKQDLQFLDPLGMAKMYADHNINVTIVELDLNSQYDISTIMACHVLNVPCSEKLKHPVMKNHMSWNKFYRTRQRRDMTQRELDKIDEIMKQWDCDKKDILEHPLIKILQLNTQLVKVLKECTDETITSRKEVKDKIGKVAEDGLGYVQMKFNTSVKPKMPYFIDIRDEKEW